MLEGPRFVASLATGHLFHSEQQEKEQEPKQNANCFLFSLVEVFQLLK